jgi:hypothetical protein
LEDVVEIPEELVSLTKLRFDDEVKQIGPPEEILDAIESALAGKEPETLAPWIEHQRGLHERAKTQLEHLWAQHGDISKGLPAWISTEWAYTLHFPWSRNLSSAVEQAEQWT